MKETKDELSDCTSIWLDTHDSTARREASDSIIKKPFDIGNVMERVLHMKDMH